MAHRAICLNITWLLTKHTLHGFQPKSLQFNNLPNDFIHSNMGTFDLNLSNYFSVCWRLRKEDATGHKNLEDKGGKLWPLYFPMGLACPEFKRQYEPLNQCLFIQEQSRKG